MAVGKTDKTKELKNERVDNFEYHTLNTSKQKLARAVSGNEASMYVVDPKTQNAESAVSESSKIIDQIDEFNEKFNNREKDIEDCKNSLKDLKDEELLPVYEGVILKPFKENPFQKIEKVGRIITNLNGARPIYKSHEDGQIHEEENAINWGVVIDAGPTCKYVRRGDIAMWLKTSQMPIPFYNNGFVLVYEHSIKVIVNKKLQKRFEEIKNNDNGK